MVGTPSKIRIEIDMSVGGNASVLAYRSIIYVLVYPPSQKATGVNPWMNARWVPSIALAKEGALRRVPPCEACGEVPRP